ncbi:MAG: hypothetical protein J6A28_01985 [Clostridia bacterium]|nr:hypothetical protein [Clostridia bacterium]
MNEFIKLIYICGNSEFQEEIMLQHKKLASQGFVSVSAGPFKRLKEKLASITDKINTADAVFVCNKNNKINRDTKKQIAIAKKLSKRILYLEPISGRA